MTRVALYTRVSTDRQEAENQRRQLRAFVKGHEGWKLVEEYRDEESGATGSRARFQALFEDAHQRKFEVLVFWALDRFSRQGTRATINYLHELESYGVGFVSYTERYLDSTGIFRDALIGLLAALANQERIRLSDRVKAGMARARIEGKHVGRPRLDDRTRRQVRELRQQKPDLSIRAIARETEVPYATTRRLLLEREKPRINVHRVLFPLTVPSLGVSRLDGKQDDIRRFLELGRFQDRHLQDHGRVPYRPLQLHEHPRAQAEPFACISTRIWLVP